MTKYYSSSSGNEPDYKDNTSDLDKPISTATTAAGSTAQRSTVGSSALGVFSLIFYEVG